MTVRHAACALVLLASPLCAQDTTRGVRIGLTYDPGAKPGVVVIPGTGAGADSIRAIVQRDFDFSDRLTVLLPDAAQAANFRDDAAPAWPVLSKLGAAAAVQVTPTATGLHVAVYDVARQSTALVRDFPAPPMSEVRAWRAAVHGLSDDVQEFLIGMRGIARTRVLFERERRIWVVDSDGEQAVPVTEVGAPQSGAWNPGGTMITYATIYSAGAPPGIVVRELAGNRTRTLVGGSGVYISPVFTPDGASVVYANGRDDGVDIFIADLAGGGSRRLSVGHGTDNVSPTCSPDGRRIAFMSSRAGHPEIYTMDADGTNVDPLTPVTFGEGAHRADPDWAPDGRTVAFTSKVSGTLQVMTIGLRDRRLKQLTSDGRNEAPSWAPDSRHLTFSSTRGEGKQLWVLDVETGRTRQLTHGTSVRNPAWSPRLSGN